MSIATTGLRPMQSLLAAAHTAGIVLTGVLAGAVLATWLNEASLGGSSELWVAYHQAITPAYTRTVPPLGGLAMVAALATLATSGWSRRDRRLVLAAVACLLVGLLVTVVAHFPMNAEIGTWRPVAPPADWQQLRDRWLTAHAVRTVFAVAGFALLVIAAPSRRPQAAPGTELE